LARPRRPLREPPVGNFVASCGENNDRPRSASAGTTITSAPDRTSRCSQARRQARVWQLSLKSTGRQRNSDSTGGRSLARDFRRSASANIEVYSYRHCADLISDSISNARFSTASTRRKPDWLQRYSRSGTRATTLFGPGLDATNPIRLRRQLITPTRFRRRNIQYLVSGKALLRKHPMSIEQIPVSLKIGTSLF
jgi:hypothetical protein